MKIREAADEVLAFGAKAFCICNAWLTRLQWGIHCGPSMGGAVWVVLPKATGRDWGLKRRMSRQTRTKNQRILLICTMYLPKLVVEFTFSASVCKVSCFVLGLYFDNLKSMISKCQNESGCGKKTRFCQQGLDEGFSVGLRPTCLWSKAFSSGYFPPHRAWAKHNSVTNGTPKKIQDTW